MSPKTRRAVRLHSSSPYFLLLAAFTALLIATGEMMLSVENLDTGHLEVAMLLDEPPCRHYMPGSMGGQPWRHNSPLVAAMRTAQLNGHAWLYIVYRGDPVLSWGSKMVKVVSGGKIYIEAKTQLGNPTGELHELHYKHIAPHLFRPMYGIAQTGGTYKVIVNCSLQVDPESGVQIGEPHPLLGYKELRGDRNVRINKNGTNENDDTKDTRSIPRDMGCLIEWTDQKQYNEIWHLQDGAGLREYRFELTEYQRRTYVKHVLEHLGFVHSDLPTRQQQLKAHMNNVSQSLNAIAELVDINENKAKNNRKDARPEVRIAEKLKGNKPIIEAPMDETPMRIDLSAIVPEQQPAPVVKIKEKKANITKNRKDSKPEKLIAKKSKANKIHRDGAVQKKAIVVDLTADDHQEKISRPTDSTYPPQKKDSSAVDAPKDALQKTVAIASAIRKSAPRKKVALASDIGKDAPQKNAALASAIRKFVPQKNVAVASDIGQVAPQKKAAIASDDKKDPSPGKVSVASSIVAPRAKVAAATNTVDAASDIRKDPQQEKVAVASGIAASGAKVASSANIVDAAFDIGKAVPIEEGKKMDAEPSDVNADAEVFATKESPATGEQEAAVVTEAFPAPPLPKMTEPESTAPAPTITYADLGKAMEGFNAKSSTEVTSEAATSKGDEEAPIAPPVASSSDLSSEESGPSNSGGNASSSSDEVVEIDDEESDLHFDF